MKKLVVFAATAGLGLTGLGATSAMAATGSADGFRPAAVKWNACPAAVTDAAQTVRGVPASITATMKCAELAVPLDYSHPNGKKITLELTLTPHTGTGPAKGDIVVNPGGPGGDGAIFGPAFFWRSSPALQAAYNAVGFSPRGVGFSNPVVHCDLHYGIEPRPPFGTGTGRSAVIWKARDKSFAQGCKTNDKIGLLDHMKTTDWAKDMNSIRMALGHNKLDYYGASYGTYLGSVYATLFPKNVGRMVLDGNESPSGDFYTDNLNQNVAFDINADYYFGWIAKYDSRYHLGTTQKAVSDFYYKTLRELTGHPVFSADKSSAASSDSLTDGVTTAGYRRSWGVWNAYATALAAYKRIATDTGSAKAADIATFVGTFGGPATGTADDNLSAVYNAVQCTDAQWPTAWGKWLKDNREQAKKYPFNVWDNLWQNVPCLYWPAKAGTPVKVGQTKDLPTNILQFEGQFDAATPLAGALEMHSALRGSHLVIEDKDRTHCIVHRGNPAVDSIFDAYFLTGALPAQSITHVPDQGDPVPPPGAASVKSQAANSTFLSDVIK